MDRFEKFAVGFTFLLLAFCIFAALAFGQCGKARVDVKNLLDGVVLPLTPVSTTILAQCSLPEPKGPWLHMPRQPSERQYLRISAMLIDAGVEADNDYHLVISDGRRTMICEIPSPACVPYGNSHAALYARARAVVDSLVHRPLWRGVKAIKPIPVTVCGIGFFDEPHHNGRGHAKNERELHPIILIR